MAGTGEAVERLLVSAGARTDARRNARRIVDAACSAVAEVGTAVTAHEIARRAGVGVGTFYRQMPSREALLEAILGDLLDEMVRVADTALADPGPWAGFAAFARAYVRLRTASCGVNEALAGRCGLDLDSRLAVLRDRMRALVERVQEAGVVRRDLGWQDVAFALASATPAEHTIGLLPDADQWLRNLAVVLAGLTGRNLAGVLADLTRP